MFDEQGTVQAFITDILATLEPIAWQQASAVDLERFETDVLIESEVREALIRLNPEIAADPDHADEVLYRLTGIIHSARGEGLVKANEEFRSWLFGEHVMPFGPAHEHVSVRLVDFNDMFRNRYRLSTEVTFRYGNVERRFDHVLWVNGLPLVVGECKSATRASVSWADGALQIDGYQRDIPEFFVPNALCFATDGRDFRYGSIRMPLDLWAPWQPRSGAKGSGSEAIRRAVTGLLTPYTLLDILRSFTVYGTDKKLRKIKTVCRYQQYEAGRRMVDRVVDRTAPRKGLVWHFQGSGKSLLMVFTAQALRADPRLEAVTVLIVVDRVDLDDQIAGTFDAANVPNVVSADVGADLRQMLVTEQRKIIITTVQKFNENNSELMSERNDVVCLVDEAHRSQDGDFGLRMRAALPNAVFFGLTGTPINRTDVNTFDTFGAGTDPKRYLSRYTHAESIRDGATLPLHFEPREARFRISSEALDAAFDSMAEGLSKEEKRALARRASRMGALIKAPNRVRMVCEDIAQHFKTKVEPEGFKAQVVVFDQEACLLYKSQLDQLLGPETSAVVISTAGLDKELRDLYHLSRAEQAALLDRFRDPDDPLKILIVTSKLLTGFDAPIAQTMYLDKVMRNHGLLQAVCRVNRPYRADGEDGHEKTHGLIIDYLGVFANLGRAMQFDEESMRQVVQDIETLWDELPSALEDCLAFFPGVDRTQDGYEGLFAAQERLPDDDTRTRFAIAFSRLARLWEALSPDTRLISYLADYQWLGKIHHSVRPSNATSPLLWRSFGPKTRELINRNVRSDTPPERLDTLVIDAELAEFLEREPDQGIRRLRPRIVDRLAQHRGDPVFDALSERLERLRLQYERGQLASLLYLKQLLEMAKDIAETERAQRQQSPEEQRRAALTRLFESTRTDGTPVAVAKLVGEIDAIVTTVRFPGWQQTVSGERDVKRALRRTLLRYQLQSDEELFRKAYDYICQYY
ncbi:type I restriction endonuclease subunit R [Streptomyces collinus]|uniref:type I restriction endonuclease subunit R n=1 Tax=Streptomyces collinus TaxID=42684 RepID=UPI00369F1142